MPNGFGCRVDANQKEIVAALKNVGASIIDTARVGKGVPDLIVGFRNETFLMEIKNPKTQYGKKGFNKLQAEWANNWNGGKVSIVRTIEEALKAIGL